MALETLKNVEQINGFKIVRKRGDLTWDQFDKKRKEYPINITEDKNMISFKIQDGPVKEVGVNGCQVDELVSTALLIIKGLNKQFPCDYNAKAMSCLYEAYTWMQQRKLDREIRNVEGLSKI